MNAVRDNGALRQELEVIEASTHALCRDTASAAPSRPRLDGVTLLYVGGRTHHVAQLRAIVEGSGATFVLHDGGIEHHLNLLAGRASQADLVVFPVDYHAARWPSSYAVRLASASSRFARPAPPPCSPHCSGRR
jgi:cupin superfamily acireductone dioxygenase involved in methionine salvage